MRSLRLILLGIGVLVLSAPTWADQIPGPDPRVVVGGGTGSAPVGFTFLFGTPSGCSPIANPFCAQDNQVGSPCTMNNSSVPGCVFQNGTETRFTSLTIDVDTTFPAGASLECGGVNKEGPFSHCSFGFDADGAIFTFTGGPGVPRGGDFSISVDGWKPDTDFGVSASGTSAVPEPGTVTLLLAGIGALALAVRARGLRIAR
jgi:PEP-CTERM motif